MSERLSVCLSVRPYSISRTLQRSESFRMLEPRKLSYIPYITIIDYSIGCKKIATGLLIRIVHTISNNEYIQNGIKEINRTTT